MAQEWLSIHWWNYDDGKKTSVFRFPQDSNENERWRKAIPRDNIPLSNDTVVCAAHWPDNFELKMVRGKRRPIHPSSMFKNIPPSMIPTPPAKPRETTKACTSKGNILPDQLSSFLENDKVTFLGLQDELIIKRLDRFIVPVTVFMINDVLYIQSQQFYSGIPLFLVKIFKNLRFETFHFGVRCYVPSLSKNYITIIDSWSNLEECIRFLTNKEMGHKKNTTQQQVSAMAPVTVGMQSYGPEIIVRAFEYFTTSRTLYNRLRIDQQLPSVTTLTRITS